VLLAIWWALGWATVAAAAGARRFGDPLPGAPAPDAELTRQFEAAWKSRDPHYRPRTRHLNPDGSPRYTNRLFLCTSPYLLQHAHNPVNWYPWGDEAFAAARRLHRPVLLSIGYSTCHWCHVMEEESFEDEEIARFINEHYVAIKVDREERPDIDAVYMSAVQTLTGRGGWPMTVWLTPERQPFYGGTYFPPHDGDRGAGVGFLTLLRKIREAYDRQPDTVVESAGALAVQIQHDLAPPAADGTLPGPEILHAALDVYRRGFDVTWGGMASIPKFPSQLPIRLLLRYHRRTGDAAALAMATLTLEKMAAGGMYDQVGGGFHRYSTDATWLVPHFEKMLYDNALLTRAYLDAYQVTGREDFARTAREILGYVERDMTSPQGAFYSASDADSLSPAGRREEGRFFTWTPQEIGAVLGESRARVVEAYFATTPSGNFGGRNILHTPRPLETVAAQLHVPTEKARALIDDARAALYTARARRPAPLRDEKILAAWNGLMISAYAHAALVLGEARYAQAGERAADFVLATMRQNGRLRRSYTRNRALEDGYLDDYACMIAACLDLYEATSTLRWLQEAMALDHVLETHFEDTAAGGFFMTGDDHEALLARAKPTYDGAEPSGNSLQVLNLLRLHELTADEHYRLRATRALAAFTPLLQRSPTAAAEMLVAVDYHLDTPQEIVIVTPRMRGDAQPLLTQLQRTFVPNRVLAVVTEGELASQAKVIPLLEGKTARGGQPTAYVCERHVCALPTTDPAVFGEQLRKVHQLPGRGQ
jgi:uncharacterized protein YyaL (SSP411 family)